MENEKFNLRIEHAAMIAIFLVIVGAGVWLFKMANAMKPRPRENIKVEYVISDDDNHNPWYRHAKVVFAKSSNEEARCLQAYRDAEEHLREQMNAWLTILGFFGVLFGLLVPLASYLLQKQSLAEERVRVTSECDKKIREVEEKIKAMTATAGSANNETSKGKNVGESTVPETAKTTGVIEPAANNAVSANPVLEGRQ